MSQLIGTAPNQVPTNGDLGSAAFMDSSAFYGTGLNPVFRNKLHNGAFLINQRATSTSTIVPSTDDNAVRFDRWKYRNSVQGNGQFSVELSTDVPTGEFYYSHKATVTTANTATSSDRVYCIGQAVEGYNFIDTAWGTAQAKPVTVSFWIKSSIPGTYSLGFMNLDASRGYAAEYTINSANTWEYKSVTVPGCVDGTWQKGSSIALQLWWMIGASPSRSVQPNQWAVLNSHGSVNNTNWIGTSGATLYMTGCQLEIGTKATPFEHRPVGLELSMCQRYYFKPSQGYTDWIAFQYGSNAYSVIPLPVPMRAAPTVVDISGSTWYQGGGTYTANANVVSSSTTYVAVTRSVTGANPAGGAGTFYPNFTASSEL